MNKILITIMLLTLTQYAAADTLNGPYIEFSGSANKVGNMHLGYVASGKLGYKFENSFRTECEISFRKNTLNQEIPYSEGEFHFKLKSLAFMGNVVYDFKNTGCKLSPYLGTGIGYVAQNQRIYYEEIIFELNETLSSYFPESIWENDGGFAYQIFTGLNYPVSDRCEVSVEFKYFNGHNDVQNNSLGCAMKQYF